MENTNNTSSGTDGKKETWDRTVDETEMQAHGTIDKAAENIRPAVDQAASTAHRTVDKLSDKAMQAKNALSEKFDQMKGQQGKWADDARVRVRENPMMAMGIAVAAGFLLRRLFSRSR